MRQLRTDRPSMRTVHEPQSPRSHPILGLFTPILSRRTSSNTSAGATSSAQCSPLILRFSSISVLSDEPVAVCRTPSGESLARSPQSPFEHHFGHPGPVFSAGPYVGDGADLVTNHRDDFGDGRFGERLAVQGILDAGRSNRGWRHRSEGDAVVVVRVCHDPYGCLSQVFPCIPVSYTHLTL